MGNEPSDKVENTELGTFSDSKLLNVNGSNIMEENASQKVKIFGPKTFQRRFFDAACKTRQKKGSDSSNEQPATESIAQHQVQLTGGFRSLVPSEKGGPGSHHAYN